MTGVRVVFSGAGGRTGRATGAALDLFPDVEVLGGVGISSAGKDLGELWHGRADGRRIYGDVQEALAALRPDALVDFTAAPHAERSLKLALLAEVRPVIGTTGLSEAALREAEQIAAESKMGAAVIANFSLVASLLEEFTLRAAPFFDGVELLELHGPHKRDKPSGTARRLQGMLHDAGQGEVPVHSVRLAGYVAHQEVLLGRPGETLTLRHDALDRSCYAAGVRAVAIGLMDRAGLYRDLAPFLSGVFD